MPRISHPDDVVKTCLDCAYGTYHPAQSGDFERPPEAAYYECRHPRLYRPAPYDPSTPPDDFRCRYWLCAGVGNADADLYHDLLADGFSREDAAFVVDCGHFTAAEMAAEFAR